MFALYLHVPLRSEIMFSLAGVKSIQWYRSKYVHIIAAPYLQYKSIHLYGGDPQDVTVVEEQWKR